MDGARHRDVGRTLPTDLPEVGARYNDEGLQGLEDTRGGSQVSSLTAEQEEAFRKRLLAGPTSEDEVCTLRGKDFKRILATGFGLLRSLAGVYCLLHRLGYSCLQPRPQHRRSNSALQEQFCRELPTRLEAIGVEGGSKWQRRAAENDSAEG